MVKHSANRFAIYEVAACYDLDFASCTKLTGCLILCVCVAQGGEAGERVAGVTRETERREGDS